MALTDQAVKNAKPGPKPRKLFDTGGLFLWVPAGTSGARKAWRLKYSFAGKEKSLSLGVYPDVSLKDAREQRDEMRKLRARGVDPSDARKANKIARIAKSENSFEVIAREWYVKHAANWARSHSEKILRRLEKNIFPWLGSRPIAEIEPPELLAVIRRIEHRGRLETAHRALQNCSSVFRYAVATGRSLRDPSADLRGALPPTKQRHHASVTDPREVGELLRAIDGYRATFPVECALRLAPLFFVRPGELRMAEWTEFDFEQAEWRIPATRMKSRRQHIVPLSTQALAILRELQQLTGDGRYLFPGARNAARHMSENTVNAALRRLGYARDQMTGHGFRSMASTLLHELGWDSEAIERQLAHVEGNSVKAAYNYAQHLPLRRKMMQAWADYLDGLKTGAKVVNLHRVAN